MSAPETFLVWPPDAVATAAPSWAKAAASETKGLSSSQPWQGPQGSEGHQSQFYHISPQLMEEGSGGRGGRGCQVPRPATPLALKAPSPGASSQPCLQNSCQTRSWEGRTRAPLGVAGFATEWLPPYAGERYLGQITKRGSPPAPHAHTY